MGHLRSRLILPLLIKSVKHFPVVGVIGVRQCGKSVLLRELFSKKFKYNYCTLDSNAVRRRALSSPDSFTEKKKDETLIIDEVQKAPDLFDSIKWRVDERRIPGSFVLSGSTEFSKETGIRESLTGRISILHLYPMVSQELLQLSSWNFIEKDHCKATLTLSQFDVRLKRGGMPGLCFIRNEDSFIKAADLWIEMSCYRDLQQVKGKTLSGALGLEILVQVAQLEEPSAANIAAAVHKDRRTVNRYLNAFEVIRILQRIDPHALGIGKSLYVLCDSGLAYHLGAKNETLLKTFLVHESLAHLQYRGYPRPNVQYFRLPKQRDSLLLFTWARTRSARRDLAIKTVDSEAPAVADFSQLNGFGKRVGRGEHGVRLIMLTQTGESYKDGAVEVQPLRG